METFLGPEKNGNKQSECHWGLKKARFSGPTPSNGPSIEFAPNKVQNWP